MTAYVSRTVLRQLDVAQSALNEHLASGPDGRCVSCREVEPCASRMRWLAVFARYGRLPQRRPGLTKAGLRQLATGERHRWLPG